MKTVQGKKRIIGGWHHVAGVLQEDLTMKLYVDGQMVGEGKATSLLKSDPAQAMEVGLDAQSAVGEYQAPLLRPM